MKDVADKKETAGKKERTGGKKRDKFTEKIKSWKLYLLTESVLSPGISTFEVVKKAIKGGVGAVQLREKDMDIKERFYLGRKVRKLTEKNNVDFIVNDRVDLAMALDADGVHLGQEDFPPGEARKLLGDDKIIGLSASSPEQIENIKKDVVDYIGFGSVFATKSKRVERERQSVGLKNLERAAQKSSVPLIAIGGISPENVSEVIGAGADGAAIISALTQAEDITGTAENMLNTVRNAEKSDRGKEE